MARSPIWSDDPLPIIELNERISGFELVPCELVTLARNTERVWRKDRGYAFFEYFVVRKKLCFSMVWDIFDPLSLKTSTTQIVWP